MQTRMRIALFVPVLAVGLVSFVFVRAQQGDGGTLIAREQHAQSLTPAAVAHVVKSTPDPVTRAAGVRAGCTPLGSGELRNPWRCSISYASGRQVQYRVTLTASGAYTGDEEIISHQGQTHPDTGVINGCCVTIP